MVPDTNARQVDQPRPQAPAYRPAVGLRLTRRLIRLLGSKTLLLIVLAALVGVGAGYGAIFFRWLIHAINDLAYPGGIGLAELSALPWYVLVLVPVAGGAIVGPLIYFLAREAKGHGVPEVMDAVANQGGRIRPRVAAVKTAASAVSIGVGASVGREGPIVQIGSSLGSTVGQILHMDDRSLRLLIGCGASAGIAATFNAPLAGALFALEVILGAGSVRIFTPLVVASVAATAISRHHLGDFPAFDVPAYELVSGWELALYVVLGCLAALVAVLFSRGLYKVEDLWNAIPLPDWSKPVLGGAMIGGLALVAPHVMGVGYEAIDGALSAGAPLGLPLMLGLVLAKILATHLSLGAGFSGGVFAPSLFIGAMLGGAFGVLANAALPPELVAPSGAYALVAMGAVVSATTHAPLTAILIVFEMSGDYRIIVPLMLACLIASVLSVRLSRESIYTLKLIRRGSPLGQSGRDEVMKATRIEVLMQPAPPPITPALPFPAIVDAVLAHGPTPVYVTAPDGQLLGTVGLEEIGSVIREGDVLGNIVIAADVMRPVFGTLKPDDTLARAVEQMTRQEREVLPVVDGDERLLGVLRHADILAHYEREVLRKDARFLTFLQSDEGAPLPVEKIRIPAGGQLEKVRVSARLAGKTLRDLDLRARYDVQVLGLQAPGDEGHLRMPDPGEPLADGDVLVVVGSAARVRQARRLLETAAE